MKYEVIVEKIQQARVFMEADTVLGAMREVELQMLIDQIKPDWKEVQQYAKDADSLE